MDDLKAIPRGTGELTDVDIISAGEGLRASPRETMVDESSICGVGVVDMTSAITQ